MTVLDVLNGVVELLRERWPEAAYYTDLTPSDFDRPSFLVEAGPVVQREAGGDTAEFTLAVKITAFLAVDAYHNTQVRALAERMAQVMALFSGGWVPVGDRRPHVDELRGEYGYDYAEVDLAVSFTERWETAEDYPLCESVEINIEEE